METENIATLFKFAIKENRETGAVTIGYRLRSVSKRWEILGHVCMHRKDLVEGKYSMQRECNCWIKVLKQMGGNGPWNIGGGFGLQ